ncbi:MAG: hypothetical protein WC807_13815 [Hyphomicrobium sp.]|jgi:hypothetical protein
MTEEQGRLYSIFGANSSSLEEVRSWVEEFSGATGEEDESDGLGGVYYTFTSKNEEIRVIKNEDVYDGEPVVDAGSEWKIVVTLAGPSTDTAWLEALKKATERFTPLLTEPY